jgi:superfamily I DNA and/or RNA helicase
MQPDRVAPGTVRYGGAEEGLWDVAQDSIVFATISERNAFALRRRQFDAIFMDEAAQCPEGLLWPVLRSTVCHLAMSGDPLQLPGHVQSEQARKRDYNRSLMDRLMALGHPRDVLVHNYRLHPDLLDFPNCRFYRGIMHSKYTQPEDIPECIRAEPLRIVHVDGQQHVDGTSYTNDAEVKAVVAEVRKLLDCLAVHQQDDVVVLTPYGKQAGVLSKHMPPSIRVHTVDSFQGRESGCVVLCTVRTDGGGFWADERRVNVALTRAKHHLCVVGHTTSWSGALGSLYAKYTTKGSDD